MHGIFYPGDVLIRLSILMMLWSSHCHLDNTLATPVSRLLSLLLARNSTFSCHRKINRRSIKTPLFWHLMDSSGMFTQYSVCQRTAFRKCGRYNHQSSKRSRYSPFRSGHPQRAIASWQSLGRHNCGISERNRATTSVGSSPQSIIRCKPQEGSIFIRVVRRRARQCNHTSSLWKRSSGSRATLVGALLYFRPGKLETQVRITTVIRQAHA